MMKKKSTYCPPTMVEYGSIVQLTKGDGASDKWDMGSGYKEGVKSEDPCPC